MDFKRMKGFQFNSKGRVIFVSVVLTLGLVFLQAPARAQLAPTNTLPQFAWSVALPAWPNSYSPVLLATDGAGNVFAADTILWKYATGGQLLWSVTNNDFPFVALGVDGSGNVFVAGTLGTTSFVVAKYNTQGSQLWERSFHQPGTIANTLASAQFDPAGNSYLTGTSTTAAGTNILTAKLDAAGAVIWATNYAGPLNQDGGAALAIDSHGNAYVTGSSVGFGTALDVVALKYDTNGNQLWAARYNGPENGDDSGSSIGVDNQGNVFVSGSSGLENPPFGGVLYTVTLKYDSGGNQSWVQRYAYPGFTRFTSGALLVPDNAGGVYVTAKFDYRAFGEAGVFKYDNRGAMVWIMFFPGDYEEYETPSAIELDEAGNALVALSSATVKIDPSGKVLWSVGLPGQRPSSFSTLTSDLTNNVWVVVYGSLAKFSQISVAAPAATILFPSDGTTMKFPSNVFVEAATTESPITMQLWDGNVKVADFAGFPQEFTWSAPGGNHILTAQFTNQSGILVTSPPVHISITTNQFPIVSITNPVDGSFFVAPATVTLGAQAHDPDGSVTKLDFYAPALLGEVTTSPYQLNFANIPAGVYTLTAQATDNEGAVGLSAPVNFTVLPANSPPVIAAPPQGQNVQLGTSLLLAPIVVGPLPLQYQWQLNGQNLSGQTNAHLSLTNVQAPQAGNYRLVVTNQYGLATSAVARLTLFATNLLFTSATTTVDGRLHLGVSAGVGTAFSVQTSTNLQSWTTLQQLTAMTQTTNLIYTLEPQTAARYFRLSSP